MDVLITGSSGLIGSALRPALQAAGHRPLRLVRGATTDPDAIGWDPKAGSIDAASLEGLDAVVNLAGAGIGDHRWTDAYKREILESRTRTTDLLARTLAGLDRKPSVLLSGSAVGFYGDRGDEVLTEQSAPGRDFLAGVCVAWEAAAEPARRGRHPCCAPPHRHRPVTRRRRAEEAAPAVQAVPGRALRWRHPVAELDQHPRRDRRDPPPARARRRRPGQPHRTAPGDERRLRQGLGPGARSPECRAGPVVRTQARPRRRAGRQPAVLQPAGARRRRWQRAATPSPSPSWRAPSATCSTRRPWPDGLRA